MKITIKDREVELKSKMRAYLIYEKLTDKVFNPITMSDILIYFYSIILANAIDIQLTFDEFVDYLDDNPSLLTDFNTWLVSENEKNNQFLDIKKNKEMK